MHLIKASFYKKEAKNLLELRLKERATLKTQTCVLPAKQGFAPLCIKAELVLRTLSPSVIKTNKSHSMSLFNRKHNKKYTISFVRIKIGF